MAQPDETAASTHYCFMWQRACDLQAWPSIYTSQELAEASPHRVGPVVPVTLKVTK
jgi:hypothetical protein